MYLDVVAALSTLAAAVFAAISAWTSARSAAAAKAAVDEAREARKAQLAPRIIVEKSFFDFQFIWPHPDSLSGGPSFLARKSVSDSKLSAPVFAIQNYGESPAIEVSVVFELEDNDEDLSVPADWQPFGVSNWQSTPLDGSEGHPGVLYRQPSGQALALGLSKRSSVEFPHLSPGKPREVELPLGIANRILLRGLQRGATRRPGEMADIELSAQISCHSMDDQRYSAEFRWRMDPFSYGPSHPFVVYSNCGELALRGNRSSSPVT